MLADLTLPDANTHRAANILRTETAVDAVEMFDYASLLQSRDISEDLGKLVKGLGGVSALMCLEDQ